ncbi:MAG: bifunctional DNA-formamidopyrimidine glycosylase/DNA-(apurinic or apyrimidinic site) lyase [Candidatus Omnitrophica bacterium]|nr:bifunctional DNA-formamidopyrimidine glycosylase/DNA-(apurinic or apyrimidinic site) lyase [Candidatus Omnitrophota bacterium]
MPELPEVETIRLDLIRDVKGKRIKDVEILNSKVIKEPKPSEFKRRLKGTTFKDFLRRAKVLAIKLSSGDYLVVHLRMTGQLIYAGKRQEKARVILCLSDGKYLNFNDQRLFAELRLVSDWLKLKFVQELGPEPLEKEFTAQKFKQMLAGKKTKIKPLLLDQTFIAGIGNLYAPEALFLAGILPTRTANKLNDKEIKKLHAAIQGVLRDGIQYRGSSVDNYVNGRGKKGEYHLRLKVYDRKDEPCVKCKTKIKKISLGGRGTCFCPKCQK